MTEPEKKRRQSRYRSDLMIAVVTVVSMWGAGVYFKLFAYLHDAANSSVRWGDDELLAVLLFMSLAAAWFAYRRWQEAERASDLAQKSDAYIHDIINNMQVALVVYQLEKIDDDRTLRLKRANPAASEFTGVDIGKLVGLTIDQAFPDIRALDLPRKYADVVRTGKSFTISEITYGDKRIKQSIFSIRAFALPEQSVGVIFENISERKRAEEDLLESRERFRELVENIDEVFWVGSPDWSEIHYISPNYEKLWGRSCESLYANPMQWIDSIVDEDKVQVLEAIDKCINSGAEKIRFPEYRIQLPDGSERWIYARAFRVSNEDGDVVRIVGIAENITEHKKAENELLESRMRFSGIVEMADDAIVSINAAQQVILFNKAAEEMFGITAADITGEHVEMLIPERFHVSHRALVERFMVRSDQPLIHRRAGMVGRRYDGEEFPMESSISKQVIGDEAVMTVMIRDLSEQVKAQEIQRKLLKAITETDEAVVITDRNAVIEYVNPAFTSITGYSEEEAIGNTPSMLKSEAQDPQFYTELWRTISEGHVWHGTLVDRRKDGTFYPAMMSVAPIHDDVGEVTHYVSLQQDMSEYKRLEDQFLQAQKMEAVGTLVGGIAHDFNNMLAALQGNVYLAKSRTNEPAVIAEKLGNIEKLSQRAAEIVRQLLTFARKDMVQMQSLPLNIFLRDGLKLAQSTVPESIECVKDICEEQVMVIADATQLQQVLMNLLNNARDAVAASENPRIRVRLETCEPAEVFRLKYPNIRAERLAHLSVEDNGSGIAPEIVDKVVEPFFTTKDVGKGTGLGLAMVYGAVQTHGGVLEIDSQPGKGTTIHIYLPVMHEQRKQIRDNAEETAHGHDELVLLVDDETVVRETVGEVLDSLGYRVVSACNGKEALDYYHAHQDEIAIVLSDVVMPGMGGIELIQKIRQLGSDVPTILLTGYDFSGRSDEVDALDNCELLGKPVAVASLSRLIRKMIRT